MIEKLHVPVANYYRHFPGIKTIVVRQSEASKEIQVTLITVGHEVKNLLTLSQELSKLPNVVSIYQNETDWRNPQVWGNKTEKLGGKNQITEEILGKKICLVSSSIFPVKPSPNS